MFTDETSDDYAPITVLGNIAIYATELLIAVHALWVIVFTVFAASTGQKMGSTSLDFVMAYNPDWILGDLQVWRLVTYAFQDYPEWGFAIGMLMLWWFGREVERFYGRRKFLIAYGVLMLIPALIGLLPFVHFSLVGPNDIHTGIFIMFAATYPGALLMFGIQARWWALGWLGISSLMEIANRDWNGLLHLWLIAGLGYGITRHLGRGEWLPEKMQTMLASFQKPKFTVVRSDPLAGKRGKEKDVEESIDSIDPILDKIASHGIASLSKKELNALKAASGELQKKDLP